VIRKGQAQKVYGGSKLHREGTPRWRTTGSTNNPLSMFGRPGDQYRYLLEEVLAGITHGAYEVEGGRISVSDGRDVITYAHRDGEWRRVIVHRNGAIAR